MVPVGMAGKDLALAARHCQSCSQNRGYLQAVWKLMGDVHLQFHSTTPPANAQLYTMHQVFDSKATGVLPAVLVLSDMDYCHTSAVFVVRRGVCFVVLLCHKLLAQWQMGSALCHARVN